LHAAVAAHVARWELFSYFESQSDPLAWVANKSRNSICIFLERLGSTFILKQSSDRTNKQQGKGRENRSDRVVVMVVDGSYICDM
jgi:hypothetical protein